MSVPLSSSRRAVVIGSGFGGLAAAIRLRARGYETTILEMRDKPGGRAYVFEDRGFTYDAGPTIITAPFLIDELFTLAGRRTEDYVPIVPVTPYYRIVFHDGRVFDYTGNEEEIVEQIRRFNPDDVPGYLEFVGKSRAIFERAFIDLADRPFSSFTDMVRVAPDLIRLRSHESVLRARLALHPGPVPAPGLQLSPAAGRRQPVPVVLHLRDDPLSGAQMGRPFRDGRDGRAGAGAGAAPH